MLAPGPAPAPAPIPGEPESLSRGLNLPLTAPVGRDDLRIWAAVFPLPFNSVLRVSVPVPVREAVGAAADGGERGRTGAAESREVILVGDALFSAGMIGTRRGRAGRRALPMSGWIERVGLIITVRGGRGGAVVSVGSAWTTEIERLDVRWERGQGLGYGSFVGMAIAAIMRL